MKLASDMIERTLDQFQAEALPDDHPAIGKLNEVYGDHTFFVDEDGLHIVEPAGPAMAGFLVGTVMRVARWKDETSLMLHEPEATDILVDLGSDGPRRPAA
jgi:hypothetical protein